MHTEYWPGMPRDDDIIRDNGSLGIPFYRIVGLKFIVAKPQVRAKVIDANATIQALLGYEAISDLEQNTLEDYMIKVQLLNMKYSNWVKN